jgi:hypothetical protein
MASAGGEQPKPGKSYKRRSVISRRSVGDNSAAGAVAGLARGLARAVTFLGRGSVAGTLAVSHVSFRAQVVFDAQKGLVEETASYPLDLIKVFANFVALCLTRHIDAYASA